METKPYNLQAPEAIAKDFGGDKQKIAAAAQSGMLDPTAAVLAGLFIDRMRSAQAMEQAPNTTVAQDVMSPQQPLVPQGQMPQGQMPQPRPEGIDALPVNEEMFDFAGGGIVAFAEGDEVKGGLSTADRNKLLQQRLHGEISEDELARYHPILRSSEDIDRVAKEKMRVNQELDKALGRRVVSVPDDRGLSVTTRSSQEYIPVEGEPFMEGFGGDLARSAKEFVRPPEAEGYGLLGAIRSPLLRAITGVRDVAGITYDQLKDAADAYSGLLVGERGKADVAALIERMLGGTTTPEDETIIAQAKQKAAQEAAQQGLPVMLDPNNLQGAVSALPQTPAPQADTAGLGALAQQAGVSTPTGPSPGSLLSRAQAEASQLLGDRGLPAEPDAQAAYDQTQKFNEMAGVNPDIFKAIAEDVRKEREDNKLSKKDAANMRVVEAGLNIMAGTSPYALTNIGNGASKAFQGYAEDIKEINKLDREMAKQEREIMVAEDQMRRGVASSAASNYSSMVSSYQTAQKDRATLEGKLYEMLSDNQTKLDVASITAKGNVDAAKESRLNFDIDKEIISARADAEKYVESLYNISNISPEAISLRELRARDQQAAYKEEENIKNARVLNRLNNLPSFSAYTGSGNNLPSDGFVLSPEGEAALNRHLAQK